MIQVPIIVNGYKISAVLDTAAEVTILSDRLLKLLDEKPKISKPVIMHAAGRDMQMKGAKLEPVRMKLGEGWYCESLYMAPIEDDMLLSLDFLLKYQAKVNLSENYLEIGKEKVSIIMGENNAVKVKRITIRKKSVIPAFSVLGVPGQMDILDSEYIVKPFVDRLLSPRTLQKASSKPILSFVNCNDRSVKLQKNQTVGFAYEIDKVIDPSLSTDRIQVTQTNVKNEDDDFMEENIPDHLIDLYTRSIENLDLDQVETVRQLLCNYSDVFAQSEFDLGTFTAIEHSIDTGDAKPIKQRIRTPQCFVGEEEKHLNKMLDAGIIEPSVSE